MSVKNIIEILNLCCELVTIMRNPEYSAYSFTWLFGLLTKLVPKVDGPYWLPW